MSNFHKNKDNYVNLLKELFPDVEDVETFYINFNIIKLLEKLKKPATINELSYELKISDQRLRVKLRNLSDAGICSIENKNKSNEKYSRNYYKLLVNSETIKKFGNYVICCRCGNTFNKYGGIIFINNSSSDGIRVFCSKECRNRWCFECR